MSPQFKSLLIDLAILAATMFAIYFAITYSLWLCELRRLAYLYE